MVGCVKTIQINLGNIEVAELPGSCAQIRSAIKILILFCIGTAWEKKTASQKNFTQRGGRPFLNDLAF